jgi:hypothetical protein
LAEKVVTAPVLPVGTAVKAYPFESVEAERRIAQPPLDPSIVAAEGVIGASYAVTLTADPGKYALLGVVNEVQEVTIAATAGQFKITFAGQQTANIAFDAVAADVQTALEALSNIAPGDVEVTGGPGDEEGTTPYVLSFAGVYAGTTVAAVTIADGDTPLSGGDGASVSTTTQGSEGTDGQCRYVLFTVDEE